LIDRSIAFTNVGQTVLTTTTDRMTLCLRDFKDSVAARMQWSAPLAVFLTLVTTLVAADFKTFLELSAEFWRASYGICALVSGLCLARAAYRAYRSRSGCGIEHVIEQIKQYR
jgi:hypothetical protein